MDLGFFLCFLLWSLQPVHFPAVVRGDGFFVSDYAYGSVKACLVEEACQFCKFFFGHLEHLLSDLTEIFVAGTPYKVQLLAVAAP